MKRTLKWLGSLALVLMLCILIFPALTTEADAASVDDLTYQIKNGEVTIINCSSQAVGSLAIPSTIEGYPVTKIGENAFNMCFDVTSITLPSSVTTIADGAFRSCGLTSFTIPNGVTTIADNAFMYCVKLTSITIPNSVKTIGKSAFENCEGLSSITIPNSVTTIGVSAFKGCESLTSITIPNSVSAISATAFSDCVSLTSIMIPDSVTTIGPGAFNNCRALRYAYYCGGNYRWADVSGTYELIDAQVIFIEMIKLDGEWYCFIGNRKDTRADALQWYNGKTYHLKNGKWQQGETKLCKVENKWYYMVNGIVNNVDKMVNFSDKWYAIKNGVVIMEDTLVEFSGKQYHVKSGYWQEGETRLYKYDGKFYYLVNGVVNKTNKLVKFDNKWYHVKDGTWQQGEHTLFKYSNKWYYLYNGIMNTTDKLFKYNNRWYHVKDGTWQQSENGLVKLSGKWYAMQNGVVNMSNTLFSFSGKIYHIKSGYWQQGEATKLYKYNNEWYYLVNGVVNKSTTICAYNNKVYYVSGGKWLRTNTTLAYNNNTIKIVNGMATGADKPTLIQQPESVIAANGETVTFKVLAVGNGLKYTWYYMDKGQTSYTKDDSVTGDTYRVTMKAACNGRRVRCVITDSNGNTVKSVAATMRMVGDNYVFGRWYLMDVNTMEVYNNVYIHFDKLEPGVCYYVVDYDGTGYDWEYYGYVDGAYVYSIADEKGFFVVDPETDIAVLTDGDALLFFARI